MNIKDFKNRIFEIANAQDFKALALEAFKIQREQCPVYREYLNLIEKGEFHPKSVEEIPFLPIRFFKSRNVITGDYCPEESLVFTSSATTGMIPSRHIVTDVTIYERSFSEAFRMFYGDSGKYNLPALLPSYLERKGSSLVYMTEKLIAETKQRGAEGGFFLYNHGELLSKLKELSDDSNAQKRKTILLGVSFALLDFAVFTKEQMPDPEERRKLFSNVIIMETGGMKGRGEELSRKELHSRLSDAFCGSPIHSEYGMCELFSQAYSFGTEWFFTPPWMRVLTRDFGGLNIIDLANIDSCCFIETEDCGRISNAEKRSVHPAFTVDGRIKNSELRGCNMLIE